MIPLIVAAFSKPSPKRLRVRLTGMYMLTATFGLMTVGLFLTDVEAGRISANVFFACLSGYFCYSTGKQAADEKRAGEGRDH